MLFTRWTALVAALLACGCTPDPPPPEEQRETLDHDAGIVIDEPPPPPLLRPRDVPPLVSAEAPPPPISGGALAVDGDRAVAGDPDRDRIHIADLATGAHHSLDAPGEPGRVVIAGQRAYVALRRGGAVLVVDLAGGPPEHARVVERIETCAAPRGLALGDGIAVGIDGPVLHVACAGGHLALIDPVAAVEVRRVALEPDLRDVVLGDGRIYVSRFRAAELLVLDATGRVTDRHFTHARHGRRQGLVAWRTIAAIGGGVWMLHQSASIAPIETERGGGYGGDVEDCGSSVVTAAVSRFDVEGNPWPMSAIPEAVLAVDLASTLDASSQEALSAAAPGSAAPGTEDVFASFMQLDTRLFRIDGCGQPTGWSLDPGRSEVTAVAARGAGFVALRREPLALIGDDGRVLVDFDAPSVADTGHALFHQNPGSGLACASCHPEGGDDGHVWRFGFGPRRTQELRGGIAGSAPFHWSRDMEDFEHLVGEVMARRMGGPPLPSAHADAMLAWIDAQPAERVDPLPHPGDVDRGRRIFDGPGGCAGCHSGPRLTDGEVRFVGRQEEVETPTLLGIGRRGSLMHDGCAETIADRFEPGCGGDYHGYVEALDADDLTDLIAYLYTL